MIGRDGVRSGATLPPLLTVAEVATWLKTTTKAIYAMIARGQLPGIVRIGTRVLVEERALLRWLDERRAASPKE